jgi:hypothetical protein
MSNIDFQNGFALGFSANGAGEGSPIQPDYLQNDPNAKDYIKNRPFYSISEEKTIAFTSSSPYSLIESVGLVEGETYDCYLSEPSGQKPDIKLTAVNVHSSLGIQAFALFYPNFDKPAYAIIDKVSVNEEVWESDDNSAVVIAMSNFWVSGLFGEIKKIDTMYLPETEIPIASNEIVGGITAYSVIGNPSATQSIYIDPDTGRLYTNPGKEYSTARPGISGLLYVPEGKGISSTSGYRPIAMHQLTGELYSQTDKIAYQYARTYVTIPNYDDRIPREVSITKELNGSKYAAVLKITVWTHEMKNGVKTNYSYTPTNYSYADILEGGFYSSSSGKETFTKIIYEIVDGNVYEDAFITAQPEKITGNNAGDQLEGFSTKLFIISSDEEAIDTLVSSLSKLELIKYGNIRIYFQTSNESPIVGDV